MNTIRDLFLDGAQTVDFIKESCRPDFDHSGEPVFYVLNEPMVAYKKLRGGYSTSTANIAKLILPAGTMIFAGSLFRCMDFMPNGRPDEKCLFSGTLDPSFRKAYDELKENREDRKYWPWFIRHTDVRKMRASEAYVESVFNVSLDGVKIHFEEDGDVVTEVILNGELAHGVSMHDWEFLYEPGKTAKPKNGFCTTDLQCSDGIHFFFNLIDALNYEL